jgi:hypothetical protein
MLIFAFYFLQSRLGFLSIRVDNSLCLTLHHGNVISFGQVVIVLHFVATFKIEDNLLRFFVDIDSDRIVDVHFEVMGCWNNFMS